MHASTITPLEACRRITADRPAFHWDGKLRWDVSTGTLEHLAGLVRPGMRTLEIGLGVSTVVLAANPDGHHTAVGISAHEFELITQYCRQIGVDLERTTFLQGPSDRVLPSVSGTFDLVLIDGAHAFPFPIVDWHYAGRLVPVGGLLILDDLPIPTVQVLHRFLITDPAWELVQLVDSRAATYRRVKEVTEGDLWKEQTVNKTYPNYRFLTPWPRTLVTTRRRLARSKSVRAALRRHPRVQTAVDRALRRFLG